MESFGLLEVLTLIVTVLGLMSIYFLELDDIWRTLTSARKYITFAGILVIIGVACLNTSPAMMNWLRNHLIIAIFLIIAVVHIVLFGAIWAWPQSKDSNPWPAIVGKVLMFGNGFFLASIVNVTMLGVEYLFCMMAPTPYPWLLYLGVALSSVLYFGYCGLQIVKTEELAAVELFFQWIIDPEEEYINLPDGTTREKLLCIKKRICWLPPWPFAGVETVELRRRLSVFGYTTGNKDEEKIASATGFQIPTSDGLINTVWGSVSWHILEAVEILKLGTPDGKPGTAMVYAEIENLTQSVLRGRATTLLSDAFCKSSDELVEEIERATAKLAPTYGIQIDEILITKIRAPAKVEASREETRVAQEQLAKERAQRASQAEEAEGQVALIEKFKNAGVSGDVSALMVATNDGKDLPVRKVIKSYELKAEGIKLPDGLQTFVLGGVPVVGNQGSNDNQQQPNNQNGGRNRGRGRGGRNRNRNNNQPQGGGQGGAQNGNNP